MADPLEDFPEVSVPTFMLAEHYGRVVAILRSQNYNATVEHSGLAPVIEIKLDDGRIAWWINSEDGWACTIFRESGPDIRKSDAPGDALPEDVARMIASLDYDEVDGA